ncbi:MAG: HAMP domain-containing histidine kinase [Pirellulales bacterium]|nr:HAMP domain-containing histidine kinase [Pirellulales bacterium]
MGGKHGASLARDNAHVVRQLRRTRRELDHVIRALSHDMSANFMLLEDSFSRLRRSLDVAPAHKLVEMADHVDACLRESRRFLDDLVRLGKTGSVEMEPEQVELGGVVDEVLFELHEPLDRRGIIVRVEQPLPRVWCNRHRVKQLISNLIRNATKHGCDAREPRITIRARPDALARTNPDAHPTVLLRVHDNGRGIPPEKDEEVFLPGRRLSTASDDGSGMGLAIVRKIAEHYGGEAWVDRESRGGTTIVVALPGMPLPAQDTDRHGPSLDHDGPHEAGGPPPYGPHGLPRPRRDRHRSWPVDDPSDDDFCPTA